MSFLLTSTRTIKLFFAHSNSPKDKNLRRDLESHLKCSLQSLRVIINWQKNQMLPGRDWKHESCEHLNTSQVIVLLVSPDFLAADDCRDITKRAMERCSSGKARVIPVKLRPIDNWQATPFGHLQCLPDNGEPITSKFWRRQDDAFVNIVEKIREEVEKIQEDQRQLQLIQEQQKAEFFASINRLISNHSLNRIIRGRNVPTFSLGIAASVIGVAALSGFCNFSPKMQVNNLLSQGQDKLDRQDYQGASENYTEVLKIAPKNINAYRKRGDARYSLKDYKAAIKDYTQAIQIAPKNVDVYIKRGEARYSLKDYKIAIKDYTQAIQIAPKNVNTYIKRGHNRHLIKDYQAAIKDYNQAIQIAPKNVNAYIKRGDAQSSLKKSQAAIDDYTKAIRLSPDSDQAYKNRGLVYENNLQNKQEAIKSYQKAATLYKKQGATDKYKKIIYKIQKLQQRKPQFSN
ncbi:toll/interleukin-1 receptor domain-containing protein [Nostoc sp.]|uniref:toll/interleukin-1 receptor domain-containing protein n=1 Tax=Nostoc sp. TaxID=1180 RepID=UPI002FFC67F2